MAAFDRSDDILKFSKLNIIEKQLLHLLVVKDCWFEVHKVHMVFPSHVEHRWDLFEIVSKDHK